MNILVTGGSGFIGTHLVSDLLKEGHRVSIYDRQKSEAYPDRCIIGDIRDKEKLADSVRGVDAVYHLAAEHRDDVRPVSLYYEVNVGGAENVVYALEKHGVDRLIFTSTVALYGLNPGEPDENSPLKPFNDYGWSKYKAEVVFNRWVEGGDARRLAIVRPAVIFGERNRGNVYNLLSQVASGRFIMVGNGKNKKSMGYVLNLSRFLTILTQINPGIHTYNYADKPDLTTEELVATALKALGRGHRMKFRIPYAIGLLGGYAFDILAKITGKRYPISSIRIKKFCAETLVRAERLKEAGFVAPYSLSEGLSWMIKSEFLQGAGRSSF
ncbi:MAG: NAD-dependent epimerase/dehydratase family protein [Thermodesulfobacteriota bacterium]